MKRLFLMAALLGSLFSYADSNYVLGGVLSIIPGYGIGHAVQGRYDERGYIFTIGEAGSLAVLAVGALSTSDCNCGGRKSAGATTMAAVGAVGFMTFKIWEIADAWLMPQPKADTQAEKSSPRFFVVPSDHSSALAGLSLRF